MDKFCSAWKQNEKHEIIQGEHADVQGCSDCRTLSEINFRVRFWLIRLYYHVVTVVYKERRCAISPLYLYDLPRSSQTSAWKCSPTFECFHWINFFVYSINEINFGKSLLFTANYIVRRIAHFPSKQTTNKELAEFITVFSLKPINQLHSNP